MFFVTACEGKEAGQEGQEGQEGGEDILNLSKKRISPRQGERCPATSREFVV